jgi:hypothetical protein
VSHPHDGLTENRDRRLRVGSVPSCVLADDDSLSSAASIAHFVLCQGICFSWPFTDRWASRLLAGWSALGDCSHGIAREQPGSMFVA